jgi:hypothetical protein
MASCLALTRRGERCKNAGLYNGYCHLHRNGSDRITTHNDQIYTPTYRPTNNQVSTQAYRFEMNQVYAPIYRSTYNQVYTPIYRPINNQVNTPTYRPINNQVNTPTYRPTNNHVYKTNFVDPNIQINPVIGNKQHAFDLLSLNKYNLLSNKDSANLLLVNKLNYLKICRRGHRITSSFTNF